MSFVLQHIRDNLWSGRLDIFPEDRIVHGFSARQGGVSPAPFDTLNMALHVGDDPAHVRENRRRYLAALGLDAERICTIRQVHGTEIVRATRRDSGRGAWDYDDALADADAIITNDIGVPLMLCYADCVPVLLYDPVHHAAGVVHAGWKGTVQRIAAQTIVHMGEKFGTAPSDVLAGIGPSIGAGWDRGCRAFSCRVSGACGKNCAGTGRGNPSRSLDGKSCADNGDRRFGGEYRPCGHMYLV